MVSKGCSNAVIAAEGIITCWDTFPSHDGYRINKHSGKPPLCAGNKGESSVFAGPSPRFLSFILSSWTSSMNLDCPARVWWDADLYPFWILFGCWAVSKDIQTMCASWLPGHLSHQGQVQVECRKQSGESGDMGLFLKALMEMSGSIATKSCHPFFS